MKWNWTILEFRNKGPSVVWGDTRGEGEVRRGARGEGQERDEGRGKGRGERGGTRGERMGRGWGYSHLPLTSSCWGMSCMISFWGHCSVFLGRCEERCQENANPSPPPSPPPPAPDSHLQVLAVIDVDLARQ